MTKRRMIFAAFTATMLIAGCTRSEPTNTGVDQPVPTNESDVPIVTNGYELERHVGERVRVVGRFHERRGSLMASPPPSHPVVNVMDVGPKTVLAYTTAPLEDRFSNCEVVVVATVLERRGPVKDGGDSGRIYEPRRQFDLQIEEIVECSAP
ncbi:MAG TPA: hypothetical protein VM869_03835 [Enhygromyxa sp.]|nr:hypothetical protein [Enhygromyxa sp.]